MKVFRCKKKRNYQLAPDHDALFKDGTIVTIGMFDGLHNGHKKVIDMLLRTSHTKNLPSIIITFDPHPRNVLQPRDKFKLLSTLKEKLDLLKTLGVSGIIVIEFSQELSQMSSDYFLKKFLLDMVNMKGFVIGHNHGFGKDRSGSISFFEKTSKEIGYDLCVLQEHVDFNESVSSSHIRKLLHDGNLTLANKLIGRPYQFSGIVMKGDTRGRRIGFPTANVKLECETKLIPKNGVYAVKIDFRGGIYKGMMNIGYRPTFMNNHKLSIEINLFSFDGDLYYKRVTVHCIKRIRNEKKFDNLEMLKNQIKLDKLVIIETLNRD